MNAATVVIAILAIIAIVFLFIFLYFLSVWVRALMSGARVSILALIGMKLRRVPPTLIVDARIRLLKAGLQLDTDSLEAHYLAGGDVINVVNALIAADKAKIDLNFQRAAAIDLAGRDVMDAVRTSVNPKVIDCPLAAPSTGGMLDAVAKDGIRLLVKARVTVRANLERLVGGAGEETIIARVGQGIVSAIGSSPTYKHVLENPDHISRRVLDSGLDAQTGFEIVSIDIADISVAGVSAVANVGALLETERAEADKKMRQAEAEGRRAMAIAEEQEMVARVQEMRAKVMEARAEVPRAMAQAFREGNLGVMDYYRMQNIESDTSMRNTIAGSPADEEDGE
ncbi:MAG: flotillin-like protein FloA [Verrucomicrobia bacterium]|nr:flotillin-like protein FloA [Verrucomicrobiota bacterium]MDA1085565.1 flotillin-like protein FloA [Verrucomicrobiota bacterium]